MYSSGRHAHSSVRSCMTEESLKRLMSPCFCALQQWPACWFSIVLLGSSSAESNPVSTCQISRFGPPRARATEPARDPACAVVYRRPPCLPRGREREKKTTGAEKKLAKSPKIVHICIVMYQVPAYPIPSHHASCPIPCLLYTSPSPRD